MGPRPLVIAHRGASAYAPDNSAEAIELARLQGADGVEVDVRVTSDGELVLSHDARHPNLEKPLIEATLADISSAGAPLLRLDEVPALLGDMLLNLEVKNHPRDPDFDPEDRVAMRVADWIAAYGLRGRTLVSSFNPATVAAVLRSDPELHTGQLLEHARGFEAEATAAAERGAQWLLPRRTAFSVGGHHKVAAAHDRGLRIGAWTVDRPAELRKLRRLAVDAVITNDPTTALRVYD